MSNRRRDRKRKPSRQAPFLDPKPLILVVCEGRNTEPQYLIGFKNACHNPRVEIRIHAEQGVPKTLVEMAKKEKTEADKAALKEGDENLRFDSVWAVFDVDDHPHIPDAVQMARDNAIELAISNPSFELWLLLHFSENPGMKNRKAVSKLLKKHVADYDKHVVYEHFRGGYSQAVIRAKKLNALATGAGTPDCNPTTGVYKLTESILVQ